MGGAQNKKNETCCQNFEILKLMSRRPPLRVEPIRIQLFLPRKTKLKYTADAEQSVLIFLCPLARRDGYSGTDTFPTQNRACLSCAQPVPCIQPLPPCSASMASMSQGHWMRRPRSEYARQTHPRRSATVHSSTGGARQCE